MIVHGSLILMKFCCHPSNKKKIECVLYALHYLAFHGLLWMREGFAIIPTSSPSSTTDFIQKFIEIHASCRDGRINVFKRLYLSHWTSRNACNICVGFKTEIQCHICCDDYCALCVFISTVRRTLFSAWEFREGNLLNYSTNSFVFLDITID